MSGQQWGSVVGGAIGSVIPVVGTYWGSVIGGIIGGIVDPTKTYGPRLGDASQQTAMDGVPRAYGDGTFPCRGNIIWVDPTVKEHKHTDDGKGSGQEQITYSYTRSYAIGVCKGPISGYKLVKRAGKVVFDARTDAELSALGYTSEQIAVTRAAQAKFLQKCTFYYGTADQLPDPTMVAVKGVGTVPGYTGTAYIVMTDDETIQGEVQQFEFVVANCGERHEDNDQGPAFDGARWIFYWNAVKPSLDGVDWTQSPISSVPSVSGAALTVVNGRVVIVARSTGVTYYADRNDMSIWSEAATIPSGVAGPATRIIGIDGRLWVPLGGGSVVPPPGYRVDGLAYIDDLVSGSWTVLPNLTHPDASNTPTTVVILRPEWGYIRGGTRVFHVSENGTDWQPAGVIPITTFSMRTGDTDGARVAVGGQVGATTAAMIYYTDDGVSFVASITPDGSGVNVNQLMHVRDDHWLAFTTAGLWVSNDGCENFEAFDLGVEIDFQVPGWGNADVNPYSGRVAMFGLTGDGVKIYVSDDFGASFAEEPYTNGPPNFMLSLNTDDSLGTAIPDAPGYYIDPETGEIIGPSGITIDVCKPTLGEIVSRQCAKRISTDVIDVSELTDLVTGFRVAAPSSPQKNIQALQPGYFFDGSEFDGKLHFPKRGGEDSFALTVDDLCERDGDLIQWETKQEPELLRKVTVGYFDPDTTYTATTQQWERRAGTVKAEGEGVVELPIVGTKDWAVQAAHKSVKSGWAEADKCTFHVSIARADLVTAAVGTITDEAGTVHRVRIERIEDEWLRRMVEARRTRADVYESTVEGAAKPLPLFPGSNIRGPTDGLLLNLPVMVDSNDVPGIAWAAAGFLPAWAGGTLQFLRAGQWVDAGTVTLPATMGTLLSPLPAHAGDLDTANILHLRMNDSLESVTYVNLLQERNPLAILYPDGTAEIVQFQTATEVAAGEYELTTLLRGRLNTVADAHATGARAVFLDSSVQYATLQPTDVGTTLTYRFVSQGTDPDAAEVQTLALTTMQSQTEWPVFDLAVAKAGDDYTVTWRKRDRLGTDVFPIRSTNWRGYEVSWIYGGNTHTETVLTESATFNLPGASDITFSVAQLNLYTGAGPAQTVTIP